MERKKTTIMLPIPQMLNHEMQDVGSRPSMPPISGLHPPQVNGASNSALYNYLGVRNQATAPQPQSTYHFQHIGLAAPAAFGSEPGTSSRTRRHSSHTPSASSSSSLPQEQVQFFIGPSRIRFKLSRTLATSNSHELAEFFNDPGRSLSREYSMPDILPEAFELWIEYVQVQSDSWGRRPFPKRVFEDLDKLIMEENERMSFLVSPGYTSSPSNSQGSSVQCRKESLLLTLFQLWYLAEKRMMPTLQNEVVLQIVFFSYYYNVLPTCSMLSESDNDHGKEGGSDRPMRRLFVDLWAEMSGKELGTALSEGKLSEWSSTALVELIMARDKMRVGYEPRVDPEDYMLPEDERDPEEDA
ncbi:hypothetical protein BKA64DRAFT_636836 [Cadophora sp. MPI-SDFR-AT-0126]|nr:hypothetical protein BKA64DRAFT_636836 [Leotiomycetes sp. MPI-SDFR-AT-0126]